MRVIVGARRSDGASAFRLFGRYPVTRSLDLKILRRRFSAVAYDFEFDLLSLIERREARPLHGRDMGKDVLPATLRLE
jgi:hypothetical protein